MVQKKSFISFTKPILTLILCSLTPEVSKRTIVSEEETTPVWMAVDYINGTFFPAKKSMVKDGGGVGDVDINISLGAYGVSVSCLRLSPSFLNEQLHECYAMLNKYK